MELPDFEEGELVEVMGMDDSSNMVVAFVGIFEGWHDLGLDDGHGKVTISKLAQVLDTQMGHSFYYSPKMVRRLNVQTR